MVPFVNGGREISLEAKTDPCGESHRPLRADAQRNRARVLEAAEVVFAAEGLSVPVDVIAEKAGVGVGTLYRHFPTKEKLFEAIIIDRIESLAEEAHCRLGSEDAGAAFFGFLEHMVAASASKRDLIVALSGAGMEPETIAPDAKARLQEGLSALLARAQRAGAVRSDVTPEIVMSLLVSTCMMADNSHMQDPMVLLGIVCDGLRAIP